MLSIGNKTFMNLQEAVGWLLENNALPFQSTANYAGNTEIPNSTLINPSPAKVRVGSLIFFADSKVSTVVGVTSNSFIVSDQYNDLVDDVVYVSNVAINASGHLIVTLSNGTDIDAGLIKQVVGFSINGSQHLIVSYNDGTTTDLGAIFSGNITISGNLTVTGSYNGNILLSQIKDSDGNQRFIEGDIQIPTISGISVSYPKWSLSGTHLMLVVAGTYDAGTTFAGETAIAGISLPSFIKNKIYPMISTVVDTKEFVILNNDYSRDTLNTYLYKTSGGLQISCSSKTFAKSGVFRIVFDLLIDSAN